MRRGRSRWPAGRKIRRGADFGWEWWAYGPKGNKTGIALTSVSAVERGKRAMEKLK